MKLCINAAPCGCRLPALNSCHYYTVGKYHPPAPLSFTTGPIPTQSKNNAKNYTKQFKTSTKQNQHGALGLFSHLQIYRLGWPTGSMGPHALARF